VTVAVSLADKLDTLVGFFLVRLRPSGSRDPFALRRAAVAAIAIIGHNNITANLRALIKQTAVPYIGYLYNRADRKLRDEILDLHKLDERAAERLQRAEATREGLISDEGLVTFSRGALMSVTGPLLDFFADRLKVQQREAGVRHDLIDAVFALGNEDDLVRLLARVNALQNFIATEDGANLLAAYKRAANILKKENWHGTEGQIAETGEEDPLAVVDDPDLKPVIDAKMADRRARQDAYTPEPAEAALIEALDSAEPRAAAAVQAEDFEGAMAALATLRAPIDRFFDDVTVNDPDRDKRAARLDLLARFRAAVHNVADFSQIEG
jgi:glycyl-tRNA synthetase beta chain